MIAGVLMMILFQATGEPRTLSHTTFAGDSAFVKMNYAAAVQLYDQSLLDRPLDPPTLWRMSRLFVCMGDAAESDQRESLYRKAEAYGKQAVTADTASSAAHAWYAAALGCRAIFEGSRTKVELSRGIKEHLDVALKLDSLNDVAWSILGSFYRAVGGVSWIERQLASLLFGGIPAGGYVEGEQALLEATRLAPTFVRHWFELGLLYEDWEKPEKASAAYRRVLTLSPRVAADANWIPRARQRLASIGDR